MQSTALSWLFRAAYLNLHPSETFEIWDEVEYFRLHPKKEATCDTCRAITCKCPYGIDIPRSLSVLHGAMVQLKDHGLVARGPEEPQSIFRDGDLEVRLVSLDTPRVLASFESRICRVFVENIGDRPWFPEERNGGLDLLLTAFLGGKRIADSRLWHEVWHGGRCHFVFKINAPSRLGQHALRLCLQRRQARQPMRFAPLRQIADVGQRFATLTTKRLTIYEGTFDVTLPAQEPKSRPFYRSSRTQTDPFRVEWRAHNIPPKLAANGCRVVYFEALNAGTEPWLVEHGFDLVVIVNGSPQSRTPLPHMSRRGNRGRGACKSGSIAGPAGVRGRFPSSGNRADGQQK